MPAIEFHFGPPSFAFYVEGQFCERLDPSIDDPAKQAWELFESVDLFPEGDSRIHVPPIDEITLTPFPTFEIAPSRDELLTREQAIEQAYVMVEEARQWRHWEGFEASLWLVALPKHQRVYEWELD